MSKEVKNEQIVLKGRISGTSNKQSDKFKTEPRKTIYFVPANEEESKKAESFGLTRYTTKDTKEDFFVCKSSESINVYVGQKYKAMVADADSNNFSVEDCSIALIKGENVGNMYYRVYAIQLHDCKIEPVRQQDPFGAEGEYSQSDDDLDIGVDTQSKSTDNTLDIASDDLPF